jgi:hypothetical protein
MLRDVDESFFTHILVEDVVGAQKRLEAADSQSHRRDLVRTILAAIEGLHWQLKKDVLIHPKLDLTHHELSALLEETYSVNRTGNVVAAPRFLPLDVSIRLVVQVVRRYRPNYTVDFSHQGWDNLTHAIKLRNRLVHPKTVGDMSVSDTDIGKATSGFSWMLALVIEVLRETNDSFTAMGKELNLPIPPHPNP